jgi:hypothetical protein
MTKPPAPRRARANRTARRSSRASPPARRRRPIPTSGTDPHLSESVDTPRLSQRNDLNSSDPTDRKLPADRQSKRRHPGRAPPPHPSRAARNARRDPFGCKHLRWKKQSAAARPRRHRTCAIAPNPSARIGAKRAPPESCLVAHAAVSTGLPLFAPTGSRVRSGRSRHDPAARDPSRSKRVISRLEAARRPERASRNHADFRLRRRSRSTLALGPSSASSRSETV